MMGAREFNPSQTSLAVATAALLAGCWTGCSTMIKSGRSDATPMGATTAGQSAAAAPGHPREVARAPLGTLSASKWQFDNGLTAVLMPDAAATSVAYTTWFRVG